MQQRLHFRIHTPDQMAQINILLPSENGVHAEPVQ